jgi:hypothetical protein
MKHKLLIIIVLLVSLTFSENEKVGTGVAIGITNSNVMPPSVYLPIASVSEYVFNRIGSHELTIEYMNLKSKSGSDQKTYLWWGGGYSFLFNLPIRYLFIGPIVGFYNLNYNHNNTFFFQISPNEYTDSESRNGAYLGGGKIGAMFGEGIIRFKIQSRILFGASVINGNSNFNAIGILDISILIAYKNSGKSKGIDIEF